MRLDHRFGPLDRQRYFALYVYLQNAVLYIEHNHIEKVEKDFHRKKVEKDNKSLFYILVLYYNYLIICIKLLFIILTIQYQSIHTYNTNKEMK